MTDVAFTPDGVPTRPTKLNEPAPIAARIVFIVLLVLGLAYGAFGLRSDITGVGETVELGVFALLGLALLIALGFEFVNGFHDTANAVATVIYTHSLHPVVAVVWSGFFNFLGVLLSSGAVAYGIITLLPVELILQVGSQAGYSMIFALLLAAIIWNLGTWWMGIPNSSSHALIGSIMGVGLANQLMAPAGQATSGVDWSQATKIIQALLFSPVVGFVASALLLLLMKTVIRNPALYQQPKANQPPPIWIRGLLILIGAAPTAYALNRTMPDSSAPAFVASAHKAQTVFAAHGAGAPAIGSVYDARAQVGAALRTQKVETPVVFASLAMLSDDIATQVKQYGSIKHVPAFATPNLRNDMYLVGDATRLLGKSKTAGLSKPDAAVLKSFQGGLENGTRFIPTWVKVSVAIALGLGTMVGWKRIVVTVGEKIGKTHMTYAQGD